MKSLQTHIHFNSKYSSILVILFLSLTLVLFILSGKKQQNLKQLAMTCALKVQGIHIIDCNGNQILLRGAMIDGEFDYINAWQNNTVPNIFTPQIFSAMHSWSMNTIRIPISQWMMQKYPAYLPKLDTAISDANNAGLYVILDFHDNTKSGSPYGDAMLHAESITWWGTMATHYLHNPMVLFDVENEPGYSSWTQWAHGDTSVKGELDALSSIRAAGSQAIVIFEPGGGAAQGKGWSGFPISLITDPNVMFSKHDYHGLVNSTQASLDAEWGTVLNKYPIFYGEWGILPVQDRQCIGFDSTTADKITNAFLSYMQSRSANWTAYQFLTNYLVQDMNSFVPTDFSGNWVCLTQQAHTKGMGAAVKAALATGVTNPPPQPSDSPTPTPIPQNTPTPTNTLPTDTPTPLVTDTPIPTPTNTDTPTLTPPVSPSPTPSATLTPASTLTPTPSQTLGSLSIHFEGIDANNNLMPHHPQRLISLQFYTSQNFAQLPVATVSAQVSFNPTDQTGTFINGAIDLSSIQQGSYYLLVKSLEGSLRAILNGANPVIITQGSVNALNGTATTPLLLHMGDLNNDNIIDLTDYNIFIDCFGSKATSQICLDHEISDSVKGLFADINDNGSVDGVDYNILIRNFGQSGF